jgi:hypothetical protein
MKIIRFLLPFLFVRNWFSGAWELSFARVVIFGAIIALSALGLMLVYIIQMPAVYTADV